MAEIIEEAIERLRYRDEETDKRLQELLREQSNFSRHYESLRAQVTAIFVAGAAAIVALAVRDGASAKHGAIILFLGIAGFALTAFYHRAHAYHWRLMHTLRKAYIKGTTSTPPAGTARATFLEIKAIFKESWRKADQARFYEGLFLKYYPAESVWIVIQLIIIVLGLSMLILGS